MVTAKENLVKKLLKAKGITNKQIAADLDLHPSHISKVLSLERRSLRVRLYLCTRLNRHYEELWGRAA